MSKILNKKVIQKNDLISRNVSLLRNVHFKRLLYKMFHNATFSKNINFACNTKSFIQIIK